MFKLGNIVRNKTRTNSQALPRLNAYHLQHQLPNLIPEVKFMGSTSQRHHWYRCSITYSQETKKIHPRKIHPRKMLYLYMKSYFRNEKSIEELVDLLDNKLNGKQFVNQYLCFLFDRLIKYAGFHTNQEILPGDQLLKRKMKWTKKIKLLIPVIEMMISKQSSKKSMEIFVQSFKSSKTANLLFKKLMVLGYFNADIEKFTKSFPLKIEFTIDKDQIETDCQKDEEMFKLDDVQDKRVPQKLMLVGELFRSYVQNQK